jgi:hypothetical protein
VEAEQEKVFTRRQDYPAIERELQLLTGGANFDDLKWARDLVKTLMPDFPQDQPLTMRECLWALSEGYRGVSRAIDSWSSLFGEINPTSYLPMNSAELSNVEEAVHRHPYWNLTGGVRHIVMRLLSTIRERNARIIQLQDRQTSTREERERD